MPNLPTKTYKFQVEIEAVPYTPETVEGLIGKGATYIDDYPEYVQAAEIMGDLLKDAICSVLEAQSNFLVQHKVQDVNKLEGSDKLFWQHLQDKEALYRRIEKTVKFVKDEA